MARQKKANEEMIGTTNDLDGLPTEVVTESDMTDLGVFEPMGSVMQPVAIMPAEDVVGFYHKRGLDIPEYATALAAGFDLRASIEPGDEVAIHSPANIPAKRAVKRGGQLVLHPGERALIPTGLYADIPDHYYMSINARSGTSWKLGLILTNSRGIIDADYVDEIKISVTNNSGVNVTIEDGDRIAQGMLHFVDRVPFKKLRCQPAPKTDRTGGFGSTGTK